MLISALNIIRPPHKSPSDGLLSVALWLSPRAPTKERMVQNFDIFDFTLNADDMAHIATLNQQDAGFINFGDPQFVKSYRELRISLWKESYHFLLQ